MILVLNEPLSVFNPAILAVAFVILVERLALTFVKEPLIADANVESEKSTASVLSEVKSPPPLKPVPVFIFLACNVSTFDSSDVTRVEKLALAVSKSVVLVENEELGNVNEPDIPVLVNVLIVEALSPNEPLILAADIVLKYCDDHEPVTAVAFKLNALPVNVIPPPAVKLVSSSINT